MQTTRTGKVTGPGKPTAQQWIDILQQIPHDSTPTINQHNATAQLDESHWSIEWTEHTP